MTVSMHIGAAALGLGPALSTMHTIDTHRRLSIRGVTFLFQGTKGSETSEIQSASSAPAGASFSVTYKKQKQYG